jgi:hypothetical protein
MSEQSEVLRQGLVQLSNNLNVTFTRYVASILPSDGYKFWVKASLILGETSPFVLSVAGSFHSSINQEQNEEDTPAVTAILFTTQYEIAEMQSVNSSSIWIGEYLGSRFSFTRRGKYYPEANVYHYYGDAILSRMESQIIDDLNDLDTGDTIVSNSLPIWLDIDSTIDVYPSYLIPTNLPPPYISVDIDQTESITAGFSIDNDGDFDNFQKEKVSLTLFGFNRKKAAEFLNTVHQHCMATDEMGVINTPIVSDEKSPQSDFNIIAQKKKISFLVNYRLSIMQIVVRRMLANATATITPVWERVFYDLLIDNAAPLDLILFDDLDSSIIVFDPT